MYSATSFSSSTCDEWNSIRAIKMGSSSSDASARLSKSIYLLNEVYILPTD